MNPRKNQGEDISFIPKQEVTDAVIFGESFAQNVTRFKTRPGFNSGSFGRGTPEFFHTQFQKSRNGVSEQSDAAITSAFAARRLADVPTLGMDKFFYAPTLQITLSFSQKFRVICIFWEIS